MGAPGSRVNSLNKGNTRRNKFKPALERLQHPAANLQHRDAVALISRLSWDDLKFILAAVRCGSYRKAGKQLGKDIATVTRRVKGIETLLNEKLFVVMPQGVEPTDAGRVAAGAALRMEANFFDFIRDLEGVSPNQAGVVRVAITEGLGTYWVMPRLVEFQRAFPRMTIDLRVAMDCVDVLRHEADIAVQFIRPDQPDLIVSKLGRLHIYPFASSEYEKIYGLPRTVAEMKQHRLIDQVGPQIDSGVWSTLLGLESIENIVGIRTNGSSSLLFAIEKGAGIGGLPTYSLALGANVVPVDVKLNHHLDIWLTYHPSLKDVTRVATVVSWLKGIFSPKRYPWFRDEFIHPRELREVGPRGFDTSFGQDFRAANAV
jgi:DNA-binding transcriptional LysR family regulator